MIFNIGKCVSMSFSFKHPTTPYTYTINNIPIAITKSFVDLGVIVNNDLKWDNHINSCIKKANQKLGLIKRITGYECKPNLKLLCYISIVRPQLEYCSQLWNCFPTKKLLISTESVQRRATKYILHDFQSNYEHRLSQLKILPLSLRREFLDLVFYYNSVNDLVDINLSIMPKYITNVHIRTRRNNDDLLLQINKVKYNAFSKFFTNRISRSWNALPYNIRNIEITPMGYNSSFKLKLKSYMHEYFDKAFDSNNTCTWVLKCTCITCRH
jgi:hypothetical protein